MYRPACLLVLLVLTGVVPAHASTRAASTGTTPCFAPLTLVLHPGPVLGADDRGGRTARDIPPEPLILHLPLYPAATSSASRFSSRAILVFPPAYRKSASATFVVPAGYSRVSNWYRTHVSACGYENESVIPLQSQGGPQYAGLELVSHQGLTRLSLLFYPISPRLTRVLYVAQAIDSPPRPAASYLRGPFVRVSVFFRSIGIIKSRTYRFTITWPATIARLVTAVNRITQVSVGSFGSGGVTLLTENAVLSFVRTDGGMRQVRIGGTLGTVVVGHSRTLVDSNGTLRRLVHRIVTLHCPGSQACT